MRTVLLVDDEPATLEALGNMLTARGWQVTTSGDGNAAVAHAAEQAFDLVLSDVVMEGLVGTALLERIRASAGNEHIPILFMSNMPERRVRSVIEGDYGFIRKPFTMEELLSAISAVMASGGATDRLPRHSHGERSRHSAA